MFCYHHATTTSNSSVPTGDSGQEVYIGVAFAGTGRVIAMPDYLGFGVDSAAVHPYIHAKSQATASVDIMRATRQLCADKQVRLKPEVGLFGYSQGGHATMCTHREIEQHHANEFKVFASAPMSGPYDLSVLQVQTLLSDEPYPQPFYLPYVLISYTTVYGFYPDEAEYLKPEYVGIFPEMFRTFARSGEINAKMPSVPKLIIKPEQITAFQEEPRHPLRLALEANDVKNFAPKAPVNAIYCEGDRDIPYQHALNAVAAWRAMGATQVSSASAGAQYEHTPCLLPAMLLGYEWFSALEE
jgi:hypothetical protein